MFIVIVVLNRKISYGRRGERSICIMCLCYDYKRSLLLLTLNHFISLVLLSDMGDAMYLSNLREGSTGPVIVMVCRKWDVTSVNGRYMSTDYIVSDKRVYLVVFRFAFVFCLPCLFSSF